MPELPPALGTKARRERPGATADAKLPGRRRVRVGGKPTAGVIKDVVMLGGFQEVEFDFVADNPGVALFHCHQQLHMDFGFMFLLNYA
jgi:FtsP/CotA-like multicopper oxidase with cupredoxin domain